MITYLYKKKRLVHVLKDKLEIWLNY